MGVDSQAPLGRDTAMCRESIRGTSSARSKWKRRLLTHWASQTLGGLPWHYGRSREGAPPFPWVQVGSAGAVLGLLGITPAGTGGYGPLLPGNGRGLGFPLRLWWLELEACNFFLLVFFWRRVFIVKNISVLLDCLFPGLLAREGKLFLSVPPGISVYGAFQHPVQDIYRKQKENPGSSLPCCLSPKVPS